MNMKLDLDEFVQVPWLRVGGPSACGGVLPFALYLGLGSLVRGTPNRQRCGTGPLTSQGNVVKHHKP